MGGFSTLDARAHSKFTLFSWFPRSASPRPRPQCPRNSRDNGREESLPPARSGRYNAILPVPSRHGAAARGPATGLPENFLHCVRTRGEPAAPVEVGHRAATVCHLGNVAMMLGRKVNWDPVAGRFVNDPEADRMLSRAMRAPWHL